MLLAVAGLFACSDDDGLDTSECIDKWDNQPSGYHDACDPTDECPGALECLTYAAGSGTSSNSELTDVCSQTCSTAADCPTVESCHCGDQTLCVEGVCGYWMCD